MKAVQISTIPDAEMDKMRLAADLALRGITFPRCTQVQRPVVPLHTPDQGLWGRVNRKDTELEATVKRGAL